MSGMNDSEKMAYACLENPLTCGFRGTRCEGSGTYPLCLKEWIKGDLYHPFCHNRSKYIVRMEQVSSVDIEVMAFDDQDAFDRAFDYYVLDVEPEMKILKVE
jgi:hypothetical protein